MQNSLSFYDRKSTFTSCPWAVDNGDCFVPPTSEKCHVLRKNTSLVLSMNEMCFYAGSPFVLNLTFLLNYLLPIRRQLPCAKLVIFKTKLPFLLESKAVRQSSQLCEWLQWLRWLSSLYMTEAERVVLESNNPNPSLFHLRYSASKCSIKGSSWFMHFTSNSDGYVIRV